MKKILLLLSIFVCALGYAQDWKPIFEAEDVAYYYKPNTKNTAWIKEVSKETKYYKKDSTGLEKIDGYTLTLWKFDCENKKIGPIQINVYSKEGNLLNNLFENDYVVDMKYIVPDSKGEGFLNIFCSKEKE